MDIKDFQFGALTTFSGGDDALVCGPEGCAPESAVEGETDGTESEAGED